MSWRRGETVGPDPSALALAQVYGLGAAVRPRGGRAGERLGAGVGGATEFQDRRSFQPGDDLRRLDWRALARTDKMLTRQYREEVSPALELVVDSSRSMGFAPDKLQLTVDLAALLISLARGEGWRARITLASGVGRRGQLADALLAEGLTLDEVGPFSETAPSLAGMLAPGALVVLLSDLLFPSAPDPWCSALAARAGQLAVVQVLGARDVAPTPGPWRLTDAETGEVLERRVDAAAISAYLGRLDALTEAARDACRRTGALFARVCSDQPTAVAARALAEAGLLVPRGLARSAGGG